MEPARRRPEASTRPPDQAPARALALLASLATLIGVLAACTQGPGPSAPVTTYPPGTPLEYAPGRSGPVETVTLPDPNGDPVTFSYEVIDGLAIFQGDMILGAAADFDTLNDADEITTESTAVYRRVCWTFLGIDVHCENYRWPSAVVPYTIANDWDDPATANDENATMRTRIRDAIDALEAVTAVRFVPRSGQDDYVRFRSSDGCSSRVGREGGRQDINLSTGCGTWSVVHEMLHALGLQHEQTRHDRDSFVQIHWDNIRSGKTHNFETHDLAFDLGSYDYDSVMHYGAYAFCKEDSSGSCVGPTIETIPAGTAIGQRSSMSDGDIRAVNRLYPGQPPTLTITNPDDGDSFSHRGANIFFSASVDDPEGMDVEVTWTDDVNGVLGTGTSLTVFTGDLDYGTHVVTARGVDPQGNAVTDQVSYAIVNRPPSVTLTAPLAGTYCVDETIAFAADVVDINEVGGTLSGSAVTWRVGSAAPFATGKSVSRSFASAGVYQVIVRATDGFGAYDEDSVTLTIDPCINQPPSVAITTPSSDTSLYYDGYDDGVGMWFKDVTLAGTASDPEDGALSGSSLVWTTDRSGIQTPMLGTGTSVSVRLYSNVCTGVTHTITLTATDSGSLSRSAIRRISIYTIC